MTICAANFALSEFTTSGAHPDLVTPIPEHYRRNAYALAIEVLQPMRDHLGSPMRITSGYRSHALNRAVGGSSTSQHRSAEAADFTAANLRKLFRDLVAGKLKVECGQCIYYPSRSFIHVALPSLRYPGPSWHVHEPEKGYQYHIVVSARQFDALTF